MKRLLLAVGLIATFAQFETANAQDEPENCCASCECALCSSIAECFLLEADECNQGGEGNCGINHPTTLCSYFWDNNTAGVTNDTPASPSNPTGCIPIDGGLGFLIAGGLGIGVLGIRRREGQDLLERAA
jgi:hypothetical protein